MAWPYDARHTTYAANTQIASADKNAEQDRIIDLHRRRAKNILTEGHPINTGAVMWTLDIDASRYNWVCASSGNIIFPVCLSGDSVIGARIHEVRLKVRNFATATMTAALKYVVLNYGAATTAPSAPATILGATDSAAGGAGSYDTMVLTPTSPPAFVDDDELYIVEVSNPTVGDEIHGVEIDYEPLTATP